MGKEKKNSLPECEEKVMTVLWNSEKDLDMTETLHRVNTQFKKEWRPQTVSTFLGRLVKKGYLTSTRIGRYHYYHPEITKEEYRIRKMWNLVEQFYDGNKIELIKNLYNENKEAAVADIENWQV